jgi:hypothetical protein
MTVKQEKKEHKEHKNALKPLMKHLSSDEKKIKSAKKCEREHEKKEMKRGK